MRQDLGGVVIVGSFRERRDLPRAFELTHHKHHHITNAKHKKCLDISIAADSRCFSSLATAQLPGE